jgi:hypothetical protein
MVCQMDDSLPLRTAAYSNANRRIAHQTALPRGLDRLPVYGAVKGFLFAQDADQALRKIVLCGRAQRFT